MTTPDTITLAGWTQRHDALKDVAPDALHLDYYPSRTLEDVFALLEPHAKNIRYAVGWSLGGWLLMRATQEGIIALEHLTLIAPPLQFVNTPDFAHGMDPKTFELFYTNYRDQPERTAARFAQLIAKGDSDPKRIVEELALPAHTTDAQTWHPWLDVLEHQKHHHLSFENFPPTLLIHGAQDTIIPLAQGRELASRIPNAALHVLPHAAHAPHLHDSHAVRRKIAQHRRQNMPEPPPASI